MKTKVFLAILLFCIPFTSSALKWHEEMVRHLLVNDKVEKYIKVERNEYNDNIKKASYKFVINPADKSSIDLIKHTLLENSIEAKKFSVDDDKILMQTVERPNKVYTYRFEKDPKDKSVYVFLISVE